MPRPRGSHYAAPLGGLVDQFLLALVDEGQQGVRVRAVHGVLLLVSETGNSFAQ
jgi:hypothetical protein